MATRLLICIAAATLLVGCRSTSSTALSRTGDDQMYKDGHCLAGVPVRVKVPTHLQIHITEDVMLQSDAGTGRLTPVKFDQPMLNVSTNLRYTEKVFTVDVKRPAAGKAQWEMEFGDDQYFDKISAEIEDETIEQVSAAVNSLLGTILPGGASRSSLAVANSPEVLKELKVVAGSRSVAWSEFDINDCDFEEQVRSFVDIHLNSCHQCATRPWNAKLPPQGSEMMPTPAATPNMAPAIAPIPVTSATLPSRHSPAARGMGQSSPGSAVAPATFAQPLGPRLPSNQGAQLRAPAPYPAPATNFVQPPYVQAGATNPLPRQ